MTQFRKVRDYKKIIELCSDALKEGLPGDWEEQIAHNKETWSSKIKDQLIQLGKQGDHEKAIELCSDALEQGLSGDWEERIVALSNKIKAQSTQVEKLENQGLQDVSEEQISIEKNNSSEYIKKKAIQLEKDKMYNELVDLCKSALENGLEGDWEYIIWKVSGIIE